MFAALKRLVGGYDLSPIPTDKLLAHEGFQVVVRHHAYQLERYMDLAEQNGGWDLQTIEAELKRQGRHVNSYNMAEYFWRVNAEAAELARCRINYGIQVAARMGRKVKNIAWINVIGAESRLEQRDEERGIRDLDLYIAIRGKPSEDDIKKVQKIAESAEEKTGIPVDFMGPGFPETADSMEHYMAIFSDPISLRGFPVFWRDKDYFLHWFLMKKNENVDYTIEQHRKLALQPYLNKA